MEDSRVIETSERRFIVDLTQDVVQFLVDDTDIAPSIVPLSQSTRYITSNFLDKYRVLFSRMTRRLDIVNGRTAADELHRVIVEMFTDGIYNWGRIATVLTFAGWLIRDCIERGVITRDEATSLTREVGRHIATALSS